MSDQEKKVYLCYTNNFSYDYSLFRCNTEMYSESFAKQCLNKLSKKSSWKGSTWRIFPADYYKRYPNFEFIFARYSFDIPSDMRPINKPPQSH